MKKYCLSFSFFIALYFPSFSQSFTPHTVSMAGSNNDAFTTAGIVGNDNGNFFVHWDDTYLYLGWNGGKTNYSSDMYYVGIDINPNTTNGATNAFQGVSFNTDPNTRRPDFVLFYENNSSFHGGPVTNGNAYELWGTSSGNFVFLSRTSGNDGTNSRISFSDANGEVRIRVAWTTLGFTRGDNNPLAITFWKNNPDGNFMWGRFPLENPSTGITPKVLNHSIIFYNTGNGVNPSTNFTIENNTFSTGPISGTQDLGISISGTGVSLSGATTFNRNLNLIAGSVLNLNGQSATLNSSLTGTGTLRGSTTSNLTIGGSGTLGTLLMDQTNPGTTNVLNNLTMNRASQTLTLANPLLLAGTITPTAGTIASGAGNLVLVSTAAGNARIAEGPAAGGYITGSAVVSRFVPNNNPTLSGPAVYRRWRFFSMPVTGTSLRQFFTGKTNTGDDLTNAGDATQNNVGTLITGHQRTAAGDGFDFWPALVNGSFLSSSSIRFYSPTGGFSSTTNTPNVTSTTPDQQGYMVFVRGDRRNTLTSSNTNVTTLPSLGALRTGNQTITIPSQTYAALGNPYVSPIDFVAVRANTGNAALIQNRFWMWDPHLATAGGWRLVKQVSGNWRAVPTPFGDGTIADQGNVEHIQPGQAVLVEPIVAGSLLIEENDKSTNTGNATIRPFETTGSDAGVLEVNLSQADNGKFNLADGILATVRNSLLEATNDPDDVIKVGNTFSALGVALIRQGSRLATEGRPDNLATDTLFLQTTGLAAGQQYRFSVNTTGAPLEAKEIKLVDQFIGTATNLAFGSTTQVEFTPTTDLNSTANTRFLIVLNNNNTLPVSFTRIAAREQQGNVAIEWAVAAETGVKHYEVEHSTNGRDFGKAGVVRARNNGAAAYSFIHQQPGSGNHYYRLRSEDADGKSQLTQVVKVTLGSSQKGFGVYPTLVSGNRLTVELNGLSKGRYTLQLNDIAGRMLMNTAIQHDGGSAAQNLKLPAGLAAGTYLIRLQGEGSSYSQKIVKE